MSRPALPRSCWRGCVHSVRFVDYRPAPNVGRAGEITILDHDSVELSNLHRQVLHTEERVGMPKAESAKIALQA